MPPLPPDLRCSATSRASAEPLAGTAVERTWLWVGVEHRSAWPARGPDAVVWPEALAAFFHALGHVAGARVQLLRQPRRQGPPVAMVADTRPGTERLWRVARDDLPTLDLDALLAGAAPHAAPVAGPQIWVCTHARRDACCGLHGGATFVALRDVLGDAVWQTSHLGGHRFAPTLLTLPDGLCHGRVDAGDAAALAHATRDGAPPNADTLRGRTAFSRPAQVAEIALRHGGAWARTEAPPLLSESVDGELAHVAFTLPDGVHTVALRREALPAPVVASCGEAPTLTSAWRAIEAA